MLKLDLGYDMARGTHKSLGVEMASNVADLPSNIFDVRVKDFDYFQMLTLDFNMIGLQSILNNFFLLVGYFFKIYFKIFKPCLHCRQPSLILNVNHSFILVSISNFFLFFVAGTL